ncbi:peptidylprolyl isomerase [Clostridium septicum]|nr:peptidylprolyl isomerase [Clostridium septicum]QAS62227.1 peptidylprolyl isomerase [Clostridium septicum]
MLATSLSLVVLVGCTSSKNNGKKEGSTENLPIATIKIKDYGNIEAELYPDIAPNTVNNFISLANDGFYNNLTFHRIIEGFMIQGGDPEGTGVGGPGYSIKGEFKSNGFENNLKHEKGVLSMARTNDPNSAGSQFFIMTEDASHLDGQYAAFGKVISGIDVLEKVEKVETDSNDKPKTDVIIESITVDTKGEKYNKPEKSK